MDHRFGSCNFRNENGCSDSNAGYGQHPGVFRERYNYPATLVNFGSEYSFTFNGPGTYNLNLPGVDVGFPVYQHQNTAFPTTHPSTVNVNSGPYEQYNQFDPMYMPPRIKPRSKSGESREASMQRGCIFNPIISKQARKRSRSGTPYPKPNPKSDQDHQIFNNEEDLHSCSQSYSSECSSMSDMTDLTNDNYNSPLFTFPEESQQKLQFSGFIPAGRLLPVPNKETNQ